MRSVPRRGIALYFFLPEPKVGCQPAGLLAWRRGNYLDLLFLGFLGFPIAFLLAFGHVDLPGLMVSELNVAGSSLFRSD